MTMVSMTGFGYAVLKLFGTTELPISLFATSLHGTRANSVMSNVPNQDIESKKLVMKSNHLFVLSTVAIAAGLTACGGCTSITPATTEQVQSPSASVAPTLSAALSAPETRLVITSVPEVASVTSARATAPILFSSPAHYCDRPSTCGDINSCSADSTSRGSGYACSSGSTTNTSSRSSTCTNFCKSASKFGRVSSSPIHAASSEELQAFNHLNAERSQCGLDC